MAEEVFLGIDVGSTTVKVAGVNQTGHPVGVPVYLRQDAWATPYEALAEALARYLASGSFVVAGAGTTGSGRELTARVLRADLSRTEIIAHATGLTHLLEMGQVTDHNSRPISRVGTLVEIGGQDSKVILFGPDGLPSFFQMNSICSAGTGEFLKQLADEAGIDVTEFGPLALRSTLPAKIDSTCTVFAKRDFRHLTQKGVPLPDRLMGACHALVRNYLRNVVPEGEVPGPVAFQGGVAYNPGVVRALAEQLQTEVIVPPLHDVIGALGMAWLAREQMGAGAAGGAAAPTPTRFRHDLAGLAFESRVQYCHGCHNACEVAQPRVRTLSGCEELAVVGGRCDGCRNPKNLADQPQADSAFTVPILREPLPPHRHPSVQGAAGGGRAFAGRPAGRSSAGRYFAGLDGGSRGTKYALIRSRGADMEVVAVGSLATAGDAVAACRTALAAVRQALPPGASLDGIGTTGSAGELFRDILSTRTSQTSDVQSTEILAHYAWAAYWTPDVGTVIDIGGNDAKIITVKQGGFDFAMNDKCAAGTGAFLEAVTRRFHVPLDQYGDVALTAAGPARIAGRCAVFGESDVVHKARIGFATADLLYGVAASVCKSYLTDVARGRTLRTPIVAQGGVFLNSAVREAFRRTLGVTESEFRVAADPRWVVGAGALGAALLSRQMYEAGYATAFKGFDAVLGAAYETQSTQCRHPECPRTCAGVIVLLEDGVPIAGYRSIDCGLGYFDGHVADEARRRHMAGLLRKGKEAAEG